MAPSSGGVTVIRRWSGVSTVSRKTSASRELGRRPVRSLPTGKRLGVDGPVVRLALAVGIGRPKGRQRQGVVAVRPLHAEPVLPRDEVHVGELCGAVVRSDIAIAQLTAVGVLPQQARDACPGDIDLPQLRNAGRGHLEGVPVVRRELAADGQATDGRGGERSVVGLRLEVGGRCGRGVDPQQVRRRRARVAGHLQRDDGPFGRCSPGSDTPWSPSRHCSSVPAASARHSRRDGPVRQMSRMSMSDPREGIIDIQGVPVLAGHPRSDVRAPPASRVQRHGHRRIAVRLRRPPTQGRPAWPPGSTASRPSLPDRSAGDGRPPGSRRSSSSAWPSASGDTLASGRPVGVVEVQLDARAERSGHAEVPRLARGQLRGRPAVGVLRVAQVATDGEGVADCAGRGGVVVRLHVPARGQRRARARSSAGRTCPAGGRRRAWSVRLMPTR